MYELQNGWTKKQMKKAILQGNMNTKSLAYGYCAYNAPDGNRCAVGCFIPDDIYFKDMEGQNIELLAHSYPGINSYLPIDAEGLCWLQLTHDNFVQYGTNTMHSVLLKWIEDNVQE